MEQIFNNAFLIPAYLFVLNGITFIIYGADKRKAEKHQWRVPEANLIGLAIAGGSIGAFFAMKVFHHKTKHAKFYIGVPVIFFLQIALAAYMTIR